MCGKVKSIGKKWAAVLSICILAVYIFTSMPIFYAISLSSSVVCDHLEHVHTEECFEKRIGNNEKVLNCDFIYTHEVIYHIHDSLCYNDDLKLICPLEENVHTHDGFCFDEAGLCCDAVFHQHNEDCFTALVDNESALVLMCGENVHRHTADCYDVQGNNPPMNTEEPDVETITLEFKYLPDGALLFASLFASEDPLADTNNSALELEYDKNITNIKIYYQVGDNWVEITEENCNNLPADAKYQFDFTYHDITVNDLIDAGGQMVYYGLPKWFNPNSNGVLLYENEIVAHITVVDGTVIVTFDEEWLSTHDSRTVLNGSLKVSGIADWRELEENGPGNKMPGVDVELDFEDNLAQKYGSLDIEKSDPAVVSGDDGRYYLEYVLTVTNSESVVMPDVTVRDIFGNSNYIKGYVGITKGLEVSGFEPQESSDSADFEPGSLSVESGNMVWNIGDLKPGETRRLVYYAEIAEDYVSNVIGNPIKNTAGVYSADNLKDVDSSTFIPKNEIQMAKSVTDVNVDNSGNGTITYSVTISAPDDNSFVLDNLTLKDVLPEELKDYLSGDGGDKITVTVDYGTPPEDQYTVDYIDASFELSGFDLEPGGTVIITYTVSVKNIFFINNGHVQLTNTATVSNGDRPLKSAVNTKNLEKQTWARKIVGSPIENKLVIDMDPADGVYEYVDNSISPENPPSESFEVPKGSLKYQVILNENGQWDLSSTSMKDKFNNDFLKYAGYVQIQLFEREDGASGDLNDSDLIGELEGSKAVKTVWLKVDSMGNFEFKPEDLGIEDGKYTYLLSYYAHPNNVENVGSVVVSNSFSLEGEVGDGNGGTQVLPGIEVSVGRVVQGGVNYDAEKSSWYYTPYPLYKTEAMESGIYPEHTDDNDGYADQYKNGAIYWVIRLENDIGTGTASGSGKNTKLSGFYVQDYPVPRTSGDLTYNTYFNRDAVVGIFVGDKSFDLTSYDSYPDFVADNYAGLKKLIGNPQNDKWFPATKVSNADYYWYADNSLLNGIIFTDNFKKKYHKETEAVYIVLRTALDAPVPTGNEATRIYTNELRIASGGNPVKVDTTDYKYESKTSLFKESKGAYIYDKKANTFENCSDVTDVNGWYISEKVDRNMLETSGIYAAWLLNVNWNGSMSGTYDVADYLPAGMELLYVDVNNFGTSIKRNSNEWPQTEYIPELNGDPYWRELTKTGKDDIGHTIETITYYNPTTREIRWRISNLTNEEGYKKREINFRIICKVPDPELFLKQKKTYVNTAAVLDPLTQEPTVIEDANVTITLKIDKNVDIELLEKLGGEMGEDNSITMVLNKLPFKLEINPFADDICDGDTLPALIDELSSTIELIEDSLEIFANGIKYTNFTYDIEHKDGHQILIIYGLPDSTPLTIKYNARLTAKPNEGVSVSNIAYWAGNPPPDKPQVDISDAKYNPSGDVFTTPAINVDITKVDADSHSKKLDGAVFELYEVDNDGNLIKPCLRIGTTDSMGKITFDNKSGGEILDFNKVYCIIETTAPNGYKLNKGGDAANSYYFIIINHNKPLSDEELDELKKLYTLIDIWYDSPEYSIIIENKKGTITVNKVFIDENGNEFTPTSGSYRFGLFDIGGTVPLEILTIVYNDDCIPDYYLDDIPKESPHFTKFEPETAYQIYELDDLGNPIITYEPIKICGIYYHVEYSAERVTVNSDATVTNYVVDKYELPLTGGSGINRYVLLGSILIFVALISYLILKRIYSGTFIESNG